MPAQKFIYTDTEAAILAVRPTSIEVDVGYRTVPGHGSIRRVQALSAEGWTTDQIAEASGLHWSVVRRLYADPHQPVRLSTAKAIARGTAVLERSKPIESSVVKKLRTEARRKGFAPLIAWDDIDGPRERPKGVRWANRQLI